MGLTTAQLQTLKADIVATPAFNTLPKNSDTASFIAGEYNKNAAPNWTVWKTNVSLVQIGDNFDGTELAGLTAANNDRLQTIAQYSAGGVNPTLLDRRKFFDDIFSGAGGTITRGKLLILWKRLALRGEKLYTTGPGTGTDASPATLTYEGAISYQDVMIARDLP